MRLILAAVSAITLAASLVAAPAAADTPNRVAARFVAGSVTDTPKPVDDTHPNGTITFRQTHRGGNIRVTGRVTGLRPNQLHVAVPYSDPICAPLPGVTAFPSGVWLTNARGAATIDTTVNVRAINPLARFDIVDTRSVSIRQVVVAAAGVPPVMTPNVPLVITEGCDTTPAVF